MGIAVLCFHKYVIKTMVYYIFMKCDHYVKSV